MAEDEEDKQFKTYIIEYELGNALARHYDTRSWTAATIFIPVSFSLIGVSFVSEEIAKKPIPALIVLAASSVLLYLLWLLIDWRYSQYCQTIFPRLHELEEKLSMYLHRGIHAQDQKLRKKKGRLFIFYRIRTWVRLMIFFLGILWGLRIWFTILSFHSIFL